MDGTASRKQTETMQIKRKTTIRERLGKPEMNCIWKDITKIDLRETG
jgi:hypothetical protein